MKIELHEISIRDVFEGYKNSAEEGVVGYGGRLNIRPKFQREYVYDDKKRDAVIDTIQKGFPLNVMYWTKSGPESYELLDGQQRTVSFCEYAAGTFSFGGLYFHNLTPDLKEKFLGYRLMVYFCEGTDSEKLDWFKIINIAGVKLTDQEMRNAIFTGEWLTDAKRHFSKTGCPAYGLAKEYMAGKPICQDYLQAVIDWISGGAIEDYMATHQHDPDANGLWLYFQNVIAWVKAAFPNTRREMNGIAWGRLFNACGGKPFDAKKLEERIAALMEDEDVTNKKGIYEYVLCGDERKLSLRAFSDKMKREAYERQKGICKKCGGHFELREMEADHITPWSKGGPTSASNCQLLCRDCNRRKSDA